MLRDASNFKCSPMPHTVKERQEKPGDGREQDCKNHDSPGACQASAHFQTGIMMIMPPGVLISSSS